MVFVLLRAAEKFEHLVAITNRDVNIFQRYKRIIKQKGIFNKKNIKYIVSFILTMEQNVMLFCVTKIDNSF